MRLKIISITILCLFIHGGFLVMATNATDFFVDDRFEVSNAAVYSEIIDLNVDLQKQTVNDRLLLMSGKDMYCEVKRVSDKFVFYTTPGNKDMEWIDRRLVKIIYYQNGVIEDLTIEEPEEKSLKDWKDVTITKKREDTAGMIKVAEFKVKHEASTRQHYFKPATLESSAEILVRRNAAQKGADIALVLKVEHHRSYGDPPVVTITAEAYKKR